MKTIAIIGGGLSGLSAGVYGQMAGFQTTIYEKSKAAGGCCFGWERNGYLIDNCIHWLCGTRKCSGRKIWEDLGALSDDTELWQREEFYTTEVDGQRITLWRNLDRTQEEMLNVSPEDRELIETYIFSVRVSETIVNALEDQNGMSDVFTGMREQMGRADVRKLVQLLRGLTLKTWSDKFKSPLLRALFLDFSAKEYEIYWLILSYAMFTSGNADVPIGGSKALIDRMVERYLSLGGHLETGKEVTSIELRKSPRETLMLPPNTASKILFSDGTEAEADYYISTLEPQFVFSKLLPAEYAPMGFTRLKDAEKSPVYSSFQVAFSVEDELRDLDTLYVPCDAMAVGTQIVDRLQIKNYRAYGENVAPKGETVIQSSFIQYPADYDFWMTLREKNLAEYRAQKLYTANRIQERIEKRFPELKGKIHFLDAWTPATYGRHLNSYKGMYMRYITTIMSPAAFLPNEVRSVDNVFLAGHVLHYPGGTPTAVSSGKSAVDRIVNQEKTIRERLLELAQKAKDIVTKEPQEKKDGEEKEAENTVENAVKDTAENAVKNAAEIGDKKENE